MFDYEWATLQHNIGCRPARRVIVARRDPARAPAPLRRRGGQARPLPGAEGGVLPRRLPARPHACRRARARSTSGSSSSCARRPTSRSTTARPTRCSRRSSTQLGSRPDVQAVVLPRTEQQRRTCERSACPRCRARARGRRARAWSRWPTSSSRAGGTMNREAVALGTPVYTTYGGSARRRGRGADPRGSPAPLTDPRAMELVKQRSRQGSRSARSAAAGRPGPRRGRMSACDARPAAARDRAPVRAPRAERARSARRALRADGRTSVTSAGRRRAPAGARPRHRRRRLVVLSPAARRSCASSSRSPRAARAVPRAAGRAAPGEMFTMYKFRTLSRTPRRGSAPTWATSSTQRTRGGADARSGACCASPSSTSSRSCGTSSAAT